MEAKNGRLGCSYFDWKLKRACVVIVIGMRNFDLTSMLVCGMMYLSDIYRIEILWLGIL
jgi:hypothetical protein